MSPSSTTTTPDPSTASAGVSAYGSGSGTPTGATTNPGLPAGSSVDPHTNYVYDSSGELLGMLDPSGVLYWPASWPPGGPTPAGSGTPLPVGSIIDPGTGHVFNANGVFIGMILANQWTGTQFRPMTQPIPDWMQQGHGITDVTMQTVGTVLAVRAAAQMTGSGIAAVRARLAMRAAATSGAAEVSAGGLTGEVTREGVQGSIEMFKEVYAEQKNLYDALRAAEKWEAARKIAEEMEIVENTLMDLYNLLSTL